MENLANPYYANINNPAPAYQPALQANVAWGYPMESYGCMMPTYSCCPPAAGFDNSFTLIVVLFILLIIVGATTVY